MVCVGAGRSIPSATAALAALTPLGMACTDEDGTERLAQGGHQWAAWEVGDIPGCTGWHVNMRVLDPDLDLSSLEPYRAYPAAPYCVWA